MTSALHTHVVVTCANRKRLPASPKLKARSLPSGLTRGRSVEWISRLTKADAPTERARDLYAGEHWAVVRSLSAIASAAGRPINLWIVSAGYGLISEGAQIRPYAATFSPAHPDSVASNGTRRHWWKQLSVWPGPEEGAPRSLAQLAQRDPESTIVVALSPPYLEACTDDLVDASALLKSRSNLSLICTGMRKRSPLSDHMLPGDARLQHALGGTRQALNVRVLAYLLGERGPMTNDNAARTVEELLSQQPAIEHYDRKRCSDAEVQNFIRSRLASDASLTHSRLLRAFRDSGSGCEQSRFAALFEEAKAPQ